MQGLEFELSIAHLFTLTGEILATVLFDQKKKYYERLSVSVVWQICG
jgi:hypothetical protein